MDTFDHLIGRVVQFNQGILDAEDYAEPGMRARIVAITPKNGCYKFRFDFAAFDAYNRHLETANFYDKDGDPCLTARESGHYEDMSDYYLNAPETWPDWFCVIEDEAGPQQLLADYFRSRKNGQTYTMWLEQQLLAMKTAA